MAKFADYRSVRCQRGIILLMLLIALAIIIIALAVAAPKIARSIRREREIEMIHRGAQYARAVKKYYKKFGRFPTSIEQLENTNNIRFLRKRYADPMSKDGNWRPVRYGETQLSESRPGILPTAGATGQTNPEGFFPADNGQQPGTSSNQRSAFGASPGSSAAAQTSQTDGVGGRQLPQLGGSSGQFGGGGILGVASTADGQGFHEYNGKAKYNQWLFIYDPYQDHGMLIVAPYNPKAFMYNRGQGGASTPPSNQQQPLSPLGGAGLSGASADSSNPASSQPSSGQTGTNP
jgi:type II secretory pathway pseudopilin PulG